MKLSNFYNHERVNLKKKNVGIEAYAAMHIKMKQNKTLKNKKVASGTDSGTNKK